jgi:hypothetical protein
VYLAGGSPVERYGFVWVDQAGEVTPLPGEPRFEPGLTNNRGWKLSPDGTQLAYRAFRAGNYDIYVLDVATGTTRQFTFHPGEDWSPRWSHDGSRITFFSTRSGSGPLDGHLWTKPADGSGEARPLFPDVNAIVGVWDADDEWLIMRTGDSLDHPSEIVAGRPTIDSVPTLRVDEQGPLFYPALSPNGRWLAYSSGGAVWVRPFPEIETETKWPVSLDGGETPIWGKNGSELFYFDPRARTLIAATYRATEVGFEVVNREPLFEIPPHFVTNGDFYDVSEDDTRFIMARLDHPGPDQDAIRDYYVVGFAEELERLAPR